jgi:hypothetical protein
MMARSVVFMVVLGVAGLVLTCFGYGVIHQAKSASVVEANYAVGGATQPQWEVKDPSQPILGSGLPL